MKRIFVAMLCLVMLLGLAACGGTGENPGTTNTDSATNPSTNMSASATDPVTDVSSGTDSAITDTNTSSDEPKEDVPLRYDPNMEHKIIITDIYNHSIVVFDLNACDGDYDLLTSNNFGIIWEWDPETDRNCKTGGPGVGIDSAKYRYSPYYERDVVIACSSNGWAGVIDYEARTLLWEYMIGMGPHSIEMLPNGDIVVACSSDPGALVYVPLSAGATRPVSSIPSLYCHGVSWDPEAEMLWVLEHFGVYAATVKDMGTMEGQIMRVGDIGDVFDDGEAGGHAFSPIYGQPGKYWASSANYLWIFDSETEELTRSYDRASTLSKGGIKGIASFADGTVVQTIARIGKMSSATWSSDGFRIVTLEDSDGKVSVLKDVDRNVIFNIKYREFYKVQPFTKDYQ